MSEQVLYGGFRRLGKFPIDPSSTFETKRDLELYLQNSPIAYPGQPLTVYGDPNPENNGVHLIIQEKNLETGESSIVLKQTATLEQVTQQIIAETNRIESEIINPLESSVNTKILAINQFIGLDESGSSGGSSNNILNRIDKIEETLKLNDADQTKDILDDIRDDMTELESSFNTKIAELKETVGNEELSKVFVKKDELDQTIETTKTSLKEEIKATNDEISAIKTILDKFDDGELNKSFEQWSKNLANLEARLEDAEDKIGEEIKNLENRFDALLIKAYDNGKGQLATLIKIFWSGTIDSITGTLNNYDKRIADNFSSIASISNRVTDLEALNLSERVTTTKFNEEISRIDSQILALNQINKQIKKFISFNFSDTDTNSINLPENITINQIKVIIEKTTIDSEISGVLSLSGATERNLNDLEEIYFDENDEYIFDSTVRLNAGITLLKLFAFKNNFKATFNGAKGKVLIEYYEN